MSAVNARVLIVDDEAAIRRFLHLTLATQAYDITEAATAKQAIAATLTCKPDVIVLDLGLPDMDGIEVIRQLREWNKTPIIVLSVRGAESDKIAALDAGADDYLTKPFGAGELLARLRVTLRRATQIADEPIITINKLKVDLPRRLVTLGGLEIQLTPREYDLLRLLVTYAGKVITQRQLLKDVWGPGYEQEYHILHVNISNLRHKIEPDPTRPQYIVTEPGVGYRIRVE